MTMPETLKPDELVSRLRREEVAISDTLSAPLLAEAADRLEALQSDLERVTAALEKINAIRNSIIGFQTVNWSAHIYPLVAALQEAGVEGEGYEIAREKAQSFVERVNAAEARALTAEAALVKARTDENEACAVIAAERVWDETDLHRASDYEAGGSDVANGIATAIRARLALSAGEEENGR